VLVNLAVNARDAMPKGGKLIVETKNMDFSNDYYAFYPRTKPSKSVLLTVTDTGHGMSEEVKSHLFEPFFTTKGPGQGTGLGLATIFGAIQQVGGHIEVQSEKGVGTTFEIYLPRIEKQAEKLDREKPPSDMPRGSETILLVEDDIRIGNLALKALKRQGYKVLYAPNGGEALMLAEKYSNRIDMLVTDVVMPVMNGRELAERLLKLHPEMKVLFTSGYTEDVILRHGVVEKNLNFIGKPYSFQAMAGKVRNVLDSRSDD
jgi:two-component system cell cycle sensor histidine kinase/response regulator CckA